MPAKARQREQTSDPVAASSAWPAHACVNQAGQLEIAGCDAVELASEFGTPSYVFAEQDMRDRAREYLSAFAAQGGESEVLYASKALPCTAAYRLFAEEGLSIDVASGGELTMALEAGCDPARIWMHGNCKSDEEIRFALESRIGYLVIDAVDEIPLIDSLAEATQPVVLRITPGIDADTHAAIATGGSESKFGLDLVGGEADRALDALSGTRNLSLVGLHAHIGSQLFDLEEFEPAISALGEFSRKHSLDLEVVNAGGGLAVSYLDDQEAPSIGDYAARKSAAVRREFGEGPRIAVEPGRSLVANAGITLYRVGSVKDAGDRRIVAVDGGMSDNLRPMLYGADYQAVVANRAAPGSEDESREVTLVGKHCESGDVLIDRALLPEPARGDLIAVAATGAYGHAMANNYNGVPRPPVVFCSDGKARAVVRRESWRDLLTRDE